MGISNWTVCYLISSDIPKINDFINFSEIPVPTTVSTTESYYRNSKHKKPYPMSNDFGVEELKDNGKLSLIIKIHFKKTQNYDVQKSILTLLNILNI